MHLTAYPVSSLEKVFADRVCTAPAYPQMRALRGEAVSFQVVYRTDTPANVTAQLQTPPSLAGSLFTVESVPADMPCYPDPLCRDDNYLFYTPGSVPDVLVPMRDAHAVEANQTYAIWVQMKISAEAKAGTYPITVALSAANAADTASSVVSFTLTVCPFTLPAQTLKVTQWFHADCIASYYQIPVFSEAHWTWMERFLRVAVEHGQTMVLTPVLTPALDTAVGAERPTVQLIDVTKTETGYTFGFDRLHRFLRMARDCGIRQFEISHLFTQWGAKAAPKVVDTDGNHLFGWDTPADGAYLDFLAQMLPALCRELQACGKPQDFVFHISDEPHSDEDLAQYKKLKEFVAPLVEGFSIMDALSRYEFYEQGATEHPVVATNAIDAYLAHQVPDLWAYYCCGQHVGCANRFLAMPSARNRILGWQLFYYDIAGFLHWGYNFYYTQYSKRALDPFVETHAGGGFPSGDAFVVYPGKDEVLVSLRLKVFYEGLQDLRALQLLAEKKGAAFVKELILRRAGGTFTFTEYPHDARFLLTLRDEINQLLCE